MLGLNQQEIEQAMLYEEGRAYNKMIYDCFNECIVSVSSKNLTSLEKNCLGNCYEKSSKLIMKLTVSLNNVNLTRSKPPASH